MGEGTPRPKTTRKATASSKKTSAETASLSSLMKRATLNDSTGLEVPKLARSSGSTLKTLRSLPFKLNLVLFTPVVPPIGNSKNAQTDQRMDPFEPLGRALSEYHKRVRHVPYVPRVGLTQTHVAFMQYAGAVVVVICEASSDTAAQENFCRTLSSLVTPDHEIPMVLVMISEHPERSTTLNPTSDFWHFDTVVQSTSYTPHDLHLVATRIFDS